MNIFGGESAFPFLSEDFSPVGLRFMGLKSHAPTITVRHQPEFHVSLRETCSFPAFAAHVTK